ncbi:hypothetical protein [Skermania piniformis]|uniref:Low molecular weight antigen MTB12-like C-terminal domain-containing protein n=1 Tax=Skermania pinensis TaxID=39122 RepID=A0ABX8SBU2_9ACTN|nr:hypothetical protein [Skermania piniformis]QXQ15262.1 hypothetical protein KV203_08075 [Skermania piniformis]
MRTSLTGRVVAGCGMVVVAAGIVTGCSSDDSSGDSATTTSASSSAVSSSAASTSAASTSAEAMPADSAAAQAAITKAYTTFFDGTLPPEERATAVEKGDVFLPILQAQAANPSGATVAVGTVTLKDATNADVGYTLSIGGNPVLPDQTGQAVELDGSWKVAAATFCALLAVQGGNSPAC